MKGMTYERLKANFPGYWITGGGLFAVVCSSASRITLVQSEALARELQHMSCGRNCDRYASPHRAWKLATNQPTRRFKPVEYREKENA